MRMKPSLHKLFGFADDGKPPLFLAPMAGYTDAAMRRACRRRGAALCHTEMTNGLGLLHADSKTWQLLETFDDEAPCVAHLYGSNPIALAEAAARVADTERFAGIDLNAGCPVRKVTACGAGAALIHDPQRIHAILAAMRKAVTLPLTVKTRLGPRPDAVMIFEILDAAESAGADALTLHTRFTSQGHGGTPDLALLAEVKRRAHIPIIGNGGVRTALDAQRMFAETGVDAVMIARAAIGNPWIFGEIAVALADGGAPDIAADGHVRRDLADIRDALESHMADTRSLFEKINARSGTATSAVAAEAHLVAVFRCHLFRYLRGLKGSSYLRGHLHLLKTLEDVRAAVAACLDRENAYRNQS